MNKFISIILSFIQTTVFSQNTSSIYFEGKITYAIHYEGKNGLDVSEFARRYGSEAVLSYKNGNSRFDFNGTDTKAHLYNSLINTRSMLIHQQGKDTLITTDLTKPSTYVICLKSEKDGLVLEQGYGLNPVQRCSYRYDSALKVDPMLTRKWYYNNLNSVFHLSKSHWIYQRIETTDFNITWTATHVQRTTVPDQIFILDIK